MKAQSGFNDVAAVENCPFANLDGAVAFCYAIDLVHIKHLAKTTSSSKIRILEKKV